MLTATQLARRKPVWTALSGLWLDTQLTRDDIKHIAQVASESGFSIAELNEIYLYEIAPVVGINLLSVAGEWAGFDTDWLHAEARKRVEQRSVWLSLWIRSGIGRRILTYATETHWQEIIPLVKLDRT